MKRRPIINIHCHLLNLSYISEQILRSSVPMHLSDNIARFVHHQALFMKKAVEFVPTIVKENEIGHIRHFLHIYTSDISVVAQSYINDMNIAKIDIAIPLIMDFEMADPKAQKQCVPYVKQIEEISQITAQYPWRYMPFVMFDPRRKDSAKLVINAIEKKGYIGVKMYPALGYFPSPHQEEKYGRSNVAEELFKLYSYCNEHYIPITTHTSPGGAYSPEFKWKTHEDVWKFTEVSNWFYVIETFKQLKINFAHFGGDFLSSIALHRIQAKAWRREILNIMSQHRLEDRIFGDLSCHDMALDKKSPDYFRKLRKTLFDYEFGGSVLFGTDASMISYRYSEKEYLDTFRNHIDYHNNVLIFSHNPIAFLFNDSTIPQSYISFLEKNNVFAIQEENLPPWIEKVRGCYKVVR